MAVEARYVVIRTDRNNEEQEVMTFTDKRSADDHDKMLDMADAMFEVLHASSVELSEQDCESLSIYLAKQREEVLFALQAKKKPNLSKKAKESTEKQADLLDEGSEQQPTQSLSETLIDQNKQSTDSKDGKNGEDNLVDFVIEKDDAA